MARPTLKAAVEWIAYNDEPSDRDVESVADFISVVLIAGIWRIAPLSVAKKVVALRIKEDV